MSKEKDFLSNLQAKLRSELRHGRYKNGTLEACPTLRGEETETEAKAASRRARDAARKRLEHQRAQLTKQREQLKTVKTSFTFSYETEEETALRRSRERERKQAYRKSQKLGQRDEQFNEDFSTNLICQEELATYQKLFPVLEDITKRPVHCTSCNFHIGTAPMNENLIKMHPLLRVIQCNGCYAFYNSGDFEIGEDGSEFYCRWCGQGGEVYCCSKCPKVFCRRCIVQNFSVAKMNEVHNSGAWVCFVCAPACMIQLRADYWALLRFIEKQKSEMANKSLSETDLQKAMTTDSSICCKETTSNATVVHVENENSLPELESGGYQDNCTPLASNTLQTPPPPLIPLNRTQNIKLNDTYKEQSFISECSLLQKAKAQFDERLAHSVEVCKHIFTKMEMLTKSTSYKNAETLLDVKELIMHFTYLLTYADSRFKSVQDKCIDDIQEMGFDPNFTDYICNDLQSLEPNTLSVENTAGNDECTTTVNMMKNNLLRAASSPLEIPEEKFQRLFRLSKESFKYLLEMATPKFKSNRRYRYSPPILKLALGLQFFAEGCLRQPVECYAKGISRSTFSSAVVEVISVLDLFCSSFIQFDQGKQEIENCKLYYNSEIGFPGVIGCIDSFHVRISKPTFYEYLYFNKNGNYSLNAMVTCNQQLLITSVAANHGGSSLVSSAWLNSLARQYLEKEYLAGDKTSWLLGDCNFPLEPWLLVPYRDEVNATEKTFNQLHSKCRMTSKMCLGVLTGRFRCLSNRRELAYRPERAAQIINVACMLHNICLNFNVPFDKNLLVKHDADSNYYCTTNLDTPNAVLTEAEHIRDGISMLMMDKHLY